MSLLQKVKVDRAIYDLVKQETSVVYDRYMAAYLHLRDEVLPTLDGGPAKALKSFFDADVQFNAWQIRFASIEIEDITPVQIEDNA